MNKEELIQTILKYGGGKYASASLQELDETALDMIYRWQVMPLIRETLVDTKGNKVRECALEHEVIEPYDPAYIEQSTVTNPCKLSAYELRLNRAVCAMQTFLRTIRAPYEYLSNGVFKVCRMNASGYCSERYVCYNDETRDYSFGTENEDEAFDVDINNLKQPILKWLNR